MIGLRFISSGMTTVTVSNFTTGILTKYLPGVAPASVPKVQDRASVTLLGTYSTTIRNLNLLFMRANKYAVNQIGKPVYVERTTDGTNWYRSPLVTAVPLPDEKTIDHLGSGVFDGELIFTRMNYWEGSLTSVPLTNQNGTDVTTGIDVTTFGDNYLISGHYRNNYVTIDGINDITGDMETPAVIRIYNPYDNSTRPGLIYLYHNVESNGVGLDYLVIEAEDFIGSGGWGSAPTVQPGTPDYTLYSSGQYINPDLGSVGQVGSLYYFLDSQLISQANNNFFRVVGRIRNDIATGQEVWAQLKLTFSSGLTLLYQTEWVLLHTDYSDIQELGTIRLPPSPFYGSTVEALRLGIHFKSTNTPSMSLDWDYFILAPLDGYRNYNPQGYGLFYQAELVDNPIEGELYVQYGASAWPYYLAYGKPIMLVPGKNQKIHFIAHDSNLYGYRSYDLEVAYRPRRLTI